MVWVPFIIVFLTQFKGNLIKFMPWAKWTGWSRQNKGKSRSLSVCLENKLNPLTYVNSELYLMVIKIASILPLGLIF